MSNVPGEELSSLPVCGGSRELRGTMPQLGGADLRMLTRGAARPGSPGRLNSVAPERDGDA
jgi:hypothetical protein